MIIGKLSFKIKSFKTSLDEVVTKHKKLKDSAFQRNEDFVFEYQFWDRDFAD